MKRMKKWVSAMLSVVLAGSLLAGCAKKEEVKTTEVQATEAQATEAAKDQESQKPALKAAMITPQKLGDDGPIDACYAGLEEGAKDFGYEIKVLEPESGEYEDSIRAMCEDGYNLIFCIFSQLQDAVSRVAPEYPDVKFVQVLGDLEMDNVKTLNFKDQEASFCSGVAAANMTKTGKVAVIAGAPVGDNIRNIAGFEAGARAANPDIQVTHLYVGSFEDPTKGKELANTLLDDGYDMILEVCASSSMGIREAIKERGKDVCMIGNCVDESKAIPGQVPFSNFTDYRKWFYGTMKEVSEGKFETGVLNQGLKEGVVQCRFADDDVMKVPQEIKDLVKDYEQKIIDGTIVPPSEIEGE